MWDSVLRTGNVKLAVGRRSQAWLVTLNGTDGSTVMSLTAEMMQVVAIVWTWKGDCLS